MASQKVTKSSKIKASHAKILHDAGYTKCLLPFGILIVANGTFENAGLLSTAKIVAELIDQDRNGIYFLQSFAKILILLVFIFNFCLWNSKNPKA